MEEQLQDGRDERAQVVQRHKLDQRLEQVEALMVGGLPVQRATIDSAPCATGNAQQSPRGQRALATVERHAAERPSDAMRKRTGPNGRAHSAIAHPPPSGLPSDLQAILALLRIRTHRPAGLVGRRGLRRVHTRRCSMGQISMTARLGAAMSFWKPPRIGAGVAGVSPAPSSPRADEGWGSPIPVRTCKGRAHLGGNELLEDAEDRLQVRH